MGTPYIKSVANIVASLHNLARANDSLIGFVHASGLRAQDCHDAISVIMWQDERRCREARATPAQVQSSGSWQRMNTKEMLHFNRAVGIGCNLLARLNRIEKHPKITQATPELIQAVIDELTRRQNRSE